LEKGRVVDVRSKAPSDKFKISWLSNECGPSDKFKPVSKNGVLEYSRTCRAAYTRPQQSSGLVAAFILYTATAVNGWQQQVSANCFRLHLLSPVSCASRMASSCSAEVVLMAATLDFFD
jgi:hypothetical protein